MKEVYDFLKKAQTYYLATVEGDRPRVRPFGTVDIFEDRPYIQTGKSKSVSRQPQANPNIASAWGHQARTVFTRPFTDS